MGVSQPEPRMIECARLLVNPLTITYWTGKRSMRMDNTWLLPYLIEEFVAASVSEIALPSSFSDRSAVDRLPPVLRQRVVFTYRSFRHVTKQVHAFLERVFLDANLVLGGEHFNEILNSDRIYGDDMFMHHYYVFPLRSYLHDLCIGMKYQLTININLEHFRECVSVLRHTCRSREARGAGEFL